MNPFAKCSAEGAVLPGGANHTNKRSISCSMKGHIVATLGELVGTFFFLFMGFAGVLNAKGTVAGGTATTEDFVFIALSFGMSLLVNAWTFFRVSGGLFNPAVTWGMFLIGKIDWVRALLLLVAQIAGGLVAAGMARALYPSDVGLRTQLADGTSVAQGFFIEMFLTLQLVLVIFLLAAAKHKATHLAPVGIGLALFLAHLAGVRYTGASLNPARSFGPAVISTTFSTYHWIYWIAPWLGSTIAVGIYKLIQLLEYETVNPPNDDTGAESKNSGFQMSSGSESE